MNFKILFALFVLLLSPACLSLMDGDGREDVMNLAGPWRFALDKENRGEEEKWWERTLEDGIDLPGTTDQAGYGEEIAGPNEGHLVRPREYVGAAWYQRNIEIPKAWRNKHLTLRLERCLWQTKVWLDNEEKGSLDSLTTPHVYHLGKVSPGNHILTVRVDNSLLVNIGIEGHSYTEETQSIWNGLVGALELEANDAVWIRSVKVFPDIRHNCVELRAYLANKSGRTIRGRVDFTLNTGERNHATFYSEADEFRVDLTLLLQKPARPWDEFSPSLYSVRVSLDAEEGRFSDHETVEFGFRKIEAKGRRIEINGRPTFLRGTLECCVFPLTGHPPTDVESWTRIWRIARSYGMNHIRFHSWCPPDAAFTAADRVGLYLQPETPLWIDGWMEQRSPSRPVLFGRDPAVVAFIEAELNRIIDAYGNHPSFCMMSMGNEIGTASDYDKLAALIDAAREKDPRRLYAVSTARTLTESDEYYVTHHTPKGPARGVGPAHTDWDFKAAVESVSVPLIAHETGQWPVYPDFREIEKYSGPLKPRPLESFRSTLASQGLLDMDAIFRKASGALTVLLYKQETEAFLRTPDYAGFQLLMLHDFPGQGEALVGILDAFWDSKGLITPASFRRFCSETVPLLRFEKYVWESDEVFSARGEIAHFGPEPITGAGCRWSIRDESRGEIKSGLLPKKDIPAGGLTRLGEIRFPLSFVERARRLKIELTIPGTSYANDWTLWVYPAKAEPPAEGDVLILTGYDDEARRALAEGRAVLLSVLDAYNDKIITNRFLPVYWSYAWFPTGPGTLGLLCDPRHSALQDFPTEYHSNWQWKELIEGSKAFILDKTPKEYLPIVQPIDDFHRNHKLGALFEARVGKGRLMVCGFDLVSDLDERPAARQMLISLLAYMRSPAFEPDVELDPVLLDEMLSVPKAARTVEALPSFEGAPLDIRPAAKLPQMNRNVSWEKQFDDVIACKDGFDFELIQGGTWKDSMGSAWHGNPLSLVIRCPRKIQGTLYAHFHDWNELNRQGLLVFEDREYLLENHGGEGRWIAFDVPGDCTLDGKLVLKATPLSGPNIMITRLIFME